MPPNLSGQIPVNKVALAASAAVATLVGGLYVDHSYGFSYDAHQIMQEKAFRTRLQQRIRTLGDDVSLYHMLQLADPEAEALWFEGRRWTYGELLLDAERLAWHFVGHGLSAGDTMAIFATNSPEMVLALAAASKVGAIPALINYALRADTLRHCLKIAGSKLLLCTPDLAPAVAELGHPLVTLSLSLSSFPAISLSSEECNVAQITQLGYEDLSSVSAPSESTRSNRRLDDVGALIYTSGTSGKPKAVGIKNFLFVVVSTPMTIDVKYRRRYLPLRTYSCLPLFHATCLFSGLFYSVGLSATFCLARKFSASRFTAQLVESRATRLLYVGELCRYLLATPASPHDQAHRCRVAMGNGLHRDVWRQFQQRFNISEIREVYRSTEGVAKFDNFARGKTGVGMVGRAGPVKRYSEDITYLVRYDSTTESPYRDPQTGFCVLAQAGEPGEAIGRVRSMDYYNAYYKDPAATKQKLISDVFEKGDLFQRTGDLLVRDKAGWIRFYDRAGDTFRWRGENVSAGEVREHISKLPEVDDASVYAVKLPAYDGQAGAAAISLVRGTNEHTFAAVLFERLRKSGLALYQLPRLVRFSKGIETTATFKQSKAVLKTLPWNPQAEGLRDSLYWLDGEEYRGLDTAAWGEIELGKARL